MKRRLFVALGIALAFASCEKVPGGHETPDVSGKVYILNNGNYGDNNTNISVYNPATKELESEVFFKANGMKLGDTAQDMIIVGDEIYISVYGSKLIFVTGRDLVVKDVIKVQIPGTDDSNSLLSPRYFTVGEGKVYVTYYEGFVGEITPSGHKVRITAVGPYPEGMAYCSGKLYVANSGGMNYPNYDKTVSVVDAAGFVETGRIDVNINPCQVFTGNNGSTIYVSSLGNYSDIPADIQTIDTKDGKVKSLGFDKYMNMSMGADGKLFVLSGGYAEDWSALPGSIFSYATTASESNFTPFAENEAVLKNSTNISVTSDGYVYVGASDYKTNGDVYVFTPEGKLHDKFDSQGLNPIKVIR